MNIKMTMKIFMLCVLCVTAALSENVLMTEVFEIEIDPPMFNWTFEGINDQYVYQPSLLNSPDLPSWINYIYSERHHMGFLYGVPPNSHNEDVLLEIVALNRKNYETRRITLPIHITEKLNPAKYEVQLKIDNLNVEDMFDIERMDRLMDVFRKKLWKDSQNDLYVTFLASAIELGARLPLNPNEGEGVVLRLGSKSHLSSELIELQEEVRPLWKVPSCPRDFKRTTVERYFREAGFALDWCAFRLLEDNSSAMQHSGTNVEKLETIGEDTILLNRWEPISRDNVPERSYVHEFLFTILLPLFVMTLLVLLLSLILCFQHEGIQDDASEQYFDDIFHICIDYWRSRHIDDVSKTDVRNYETIQKATNTLRNLSNNRDFSCLSPEPILISRSHTNSPTSTLGRGVHFRPSPPPYVKPKFKSDF